MKPTFPLPSFCRTILAGGCLLLALSAQATTPWTLDQCINYATSNNITIKIREASVTSAELSVTDAKSSFLPTVSAGANQSWNLGRGLTAENTYANRNTSNFGWNGSASLPLFQGMRRVRQLEYAKLNLAAITEQCEAAKEDITINVITGYLQVLYCREMMEVAQSQVALSEHELIRRQALLEAGKIPEADMLEAKAQLASDQLSLTQATNDLALARLDLAQLLQLGSDISDFDVAPLSDNGDTLLINPDEAYSQALEHNHSIAAARKNIVSSEQAISVAKSGYLPSLSFSAGLGSSYYKLSGFQNESFGQQMRHNYSTYFGFSLNVPIFDAFSTRNSVRRAKVEKLQAELQLDQTEQQLLRAVQQAYYQAVASRDKLASSLMAEEATQAAFDAISEKYSLGRATPTEYEQAKTKALRATSDRVQARYEPLLRSRLLSFYATGRQ